MASPLTEQINNVDAAYQASQSGTAIADNSGVRAAPTTVTAATATAAQNNPTTPPPTAAAAPGKQTFTGLCAALNAFQQAQVKAGQAKVADQYEIVFLPKNLIGNAKITKPGGVVQQNTSMNLDSSAAAKVDPNKSSVNNTSYVVPIYAGTQIVQFIDEVIRSSSYITDQASIIIDKDTGKMRPNANVKNGQIAWYKINVSSTPLGYDEIRKQDAYKMRFVITPYAISELESEYFPQTNFRGLHKSYNYWFTGQNTAILHFEQEYNYLYKQVMTGRITQGVAKQSDSREFYEKTWAVASSENSKGAANAANEVGANAADWLYNPSDLALVKLKIVGDPAWMQQGEITTGANPSTFSFQPFLSDGTINFDSQQVCFDITWNQPVDYNFSTGIADVNVNNVNKNTTNLPAQNYTYLFVECTSTFSKGKFEQEITGKLMPNPVKKTSSTGATTVPPVGNAQPETGATTAPADGVRQPNIANGTETDASTNGNPVNPAPNNSLETAPGSLPQPLPAAPAQPPTSNGDIVSTEQAGPPVALASTQARITNALTLPGQVVTGAVLGGTPLQSGTQTPKVNSTTQNMNIET